MSILKPDTNLFAVANRIADIPIDSNDRFLVRRDEEHSKSSQDEGEPVEVEDEASGNERDDDDKEHHREAMPLSRVQQ